MQKQLLTNDFFFFFFIVKYIEHIIEVTELTGSVLNFGKNLPH